VKSRGVKVVMFSGRNRRAENYFPFFSQQIMYSLFTLLSRCIITVTIQFPDFLFRMLTCLKIRFTLFSFIASGRSVCLDPDQNGFVVLKTGGIRYNLSSIPDLQPEWKPSCLTITVV
jgi:hypothetical protein